MSNDMISLQNLMGSVSGLNQSMEATRLYVLLHSNSNNPNISEYHSRFNQLTNKYTGFAREFSSELDQFQRLLLNNIQSQQIEQEKEKERLLEKLEIVSNQSNNYNNYNNNNTLEIVNNLTEIDYSPATSIKNEFEEDNNSYFEPAESVTVSVPVSVSNPVPTPIQSKSEKLKVAKKQSIKKEAKKSKMASRKNATNKAQKTQKKAMKVNNNNNYKGLTAQRPYKYDANRVRWRFNEVQRSSTMIYIGNIGWNVKVAAIQFFVMKKAKITMRQIEETQLKETSHGKYALLRFRSDVSIDRIQTFMDRINTENAKIKEENRRNEIMGKNKKNKKKGKNDKVIKNENKNKNKNNKKTSWQRRVFLKFNNTFKYYESEEAMYSDQAARNELFIRNFDVLDRKCHHELSHKLLEYGELSKDIVIRLDSFGDPYCIATFKYIEDAIICCNDAVDFHARTLEMRYSKF